MKLFSYGGPHTNNHLEFWHNRIKKIVRKLHPNIYKLIEILQKEQAIIEVTIRQLEEGGIIRARRRKWVKRDEKTQKLKQNLKMAPEH